MTKGQRDPLPIQQTRGRFVNARSLVVFSQVSPNCIFAYCSNRSPRKSWLIPQVLAH